MKRCLFAIILTILVLGLTGCGGSNDEQSFKEAFKLAFTDPAEEISDPGSVASILYSYDWKVYDQNSRLAELIQRLISKQGYKASVNGNLKITEAFYTFVPSDGVLVIKAYCKYIKPGKGEVQRLIQIDCGHTYVPLSESQLYLQTGDEWYLSLHYQNKEEKFIDNESPDAEPWSGCRYNRHEIKEVTKSGNGQDFWRPTIRYASENYIVFSSNIYLKRI